MTNTSSLRPAQRELDRRSLLIGASGVVGAAALALPETAEAATARLTRARLERVITSALGSSSSRVGLTVIDRRTGVWHSHNGGRRVQSASTAKVLILVAFLRRRRAQGRALSSSDRSLVQAMIRYSDNNAASTLRSRAGGGAAVAAAAQAAGMPSTAASARSQGSWGKVLTTSEEEARLLNTLANGGGRVLGRTDAAYVLSEMRRVTSSQAWGAGIVRSSTVSVAVKNGWAPLSPDYSWRVNTLGVVRGGGRDYVIACYEDGLSSMQRGVNHKNAVCRAVHGALAQRLYTA